MKKLTDESLGTIVSILVNEKIEAEKNNKEGISNEYIKSINVALEELKEIVKEREMNDGKI